MAVQKGDAEKSSKACAKLQELLKPYAEDVM
jgi:hypothetical protein